MYCYRENIIKLCSLSYMSGKRVTSGKRSYKCKKYKNTTDGMLPQCSEWSTEAPHRSDWSECNHFFFSLTPHKSFPASPSVTENNMGAMHSHRPAVHAVQTSSSTAWLLLSLVLTSALPSCSSPGLGIPISPCSFSLSVSNPTGPMLQHLLRLSPGACPKVMSHFGNSSSHVKRAVCNPVFHRRVLSPSPPREVPVSHQEELPSEISFSSWHTCTGG